MIVTYKQTPIRYAVITWDKTHEERLQTKKSDDDYQTAWECMATWYPVRLFGSLMEGGKFHLTIWSDNLGAVHVAMIEN